MLELFKIKYSDLARIKKLPPRDQGHYLPFNSYPHGCPLGGFGAGTIGRSPYGDFNIWHIKVGAHIMEELKSCCFHVYQKVKGEDKVFLNTLTTRKFSDKNLKLFGQPYSNHAGTYSAAYPKAKYTFAAAHTPAEISCEQYSPILPDNYQETSYPVAVFEHTIRNKTNKKIEVSLMLSWANLTGWKFEDQRPGIQDNWYAFVKDSKDKLHKQKNTTLAGKKIVGVILGQNKKQAQNEMDGEIGIFAAGNKNDLVTCQEYFYLNGSGAELYEQFAKDGTLKNKPLVNMLEHQNYGAAVAVKVKLEPGETKKIPFVLVWDLPVVHFGPGVNKLKYYTKYFNASGKNSWALALAAFKKYPDWSKKIDAWHDQIIQNSKLKELYNSETLAAYFKMLVNELYFLADGGCFWDAQTGDFGLLECFDYPFYETLDVRFYGSFPILKYWPKIELAIMQKFSTTISQEYKNKMRFHKYTDNLELPLPAVPRERILYYDIKKKKGACPHDLGSPKENPFTIPAGYTWQNTNYWKDLNPKFILLIYRDYFYTKDLTFLKKCWPAMQTAAEYLIKMDKDQDGIPENSGYPDQTYDNWIMKGVSAYCGTLWLATLKAMSATAALLKQPKSAEKYSALLKKAEQAFQKKLWNGHYFDFCSGNNDIMADQLIGQWYSELIGLGDILPPEQIEKTLRTIYRYNFLKTKGGKWGVISGKKRSNKHVDAEQGRDVWIGANFALCSLLLHHNQPKAAEKILNSLAEIIYNRGFFFRTPEGWDTNGHFTATMYMRPNAIWSLEF